MKLTVQQMMVLGAFGTSIIVLLAMMNWRRAVYAAMVVALFEGAIRKWIFPQGSELVYFFKDIILFGAYLKFFMFPDPEIRAWRVRVPGTLITVVCVTLVMVGAVNPNIGSIVLAGYGLKIYLWYIPLGVMIPLLFRNEAEMTTMLFRYSLFAIPICLLGAAQFVAGPGSWLNVYAATDYVQMQVATFGAGQDATARITGTFSYISGHAVFVQFFFILSLGLLTGINDKRRWVLLLGNLPLLVANGLMAGSRGAVYGMLLVGAIMGATSSVSKVGKGRNTLPYLLLGAALIMIGVNVFFSKALTAFEIRRTHADDSTVGRMMYPVNSVIAASKVVDVMGFGIGMSHPASMALRRALNIPRPDNYCPLYDAETGQVLAELGWPGFVVWYIFRTVMVWQCWLAFRYSPPSMFRSLALGFFCYELLLLTGSFVLNHTANVFACAAWGFCLIPNLESLVRRTRPMPVNKQQIIQGRGSRVPRLHR